MLSKTIGSDELELIIYGNPITKKNSSRIVKCNNFTRLLPSAQFVRYENDCLRQITGKDRKKINKKINLKAVYYMRARYRVDLVNLLEATCDILVKANVLEDDNSKIVASHDGSRVDYDKSNPRVEIIITEIEQEK